MPEQPAKRHVIILGAGASATSGYPMAEKLRLLMSSKKVLGEELQKALNDEDASKILESMMGGQMAGTIELFRDGGFATLDEFSYLARSRFPRDVQALKGFLGFTLALQDPEENFHKSDYYPFIQKLFQKNLFPLRNDISVLTFNYDPYLPYLLSRAYRVRCRAVGKPEAANAVDAITGGFFSRNVDALEDGDDLCVLQLHGSIAWPKKLRDSDTISFGDLFGVPTTERLQKLCRSDSTSAFPPILFPWEIVNERGVILQGQDFCLNDRVNGASARQGGYEGDVSIHQLFVSIWKRAQKEITHATKISFVGLSMHEFLDPAFRFLFANRKKDAAIVCANWDHRSFPGSGIERATEIHLNPLSPTFKLRRLLKEICPEIKGKGAYPNALVRVLASGSELQVRVREDFADFIQNELD